MKRDGLWVNGEREIGSGDWKPVIDNRLLPVYAIGEGPVEAFTQSPVQFPLRQPRWKRSEHQRTRGLEHACAHGKALGTAELRIALAQELLHRRTGVTAHAGIPPVMALFQGAAPNDAGNRDPRPW